MEHIDYEDYKVVGGRCESKDFPMLLLDCETYLEMVTFGSINDISLDIKAKRLIARVIDDVLVPKKERELGATSYSDDIESVSYDPQEFSEKNTKKKIVKLCIQYLPSELLYRGVNDGR